jgi:hypothetical protein
MQRADARVSERPLFSERNRSWDAFTVPVFQRLDHTSFS